MSMSSVQKKKKNLATGPNKTLVGRIHPVVVGMAPLCPQEEQHVGMRNTDTLAKADSSRKKMGHGVDRRWCLVDWGDRMR